MNFRGNGIWRQDGSSIFYVQSEPSQYSESEPGQYSESEPGQYSDSQSGPYSEYQPGQYQDQDQDHWVTRQQYVERYDYAGRPYPSELNPLDITKIAETTVLGAIVLYLLVKVLVPTITEDRARALTAIEKLTAAIDKLSDRFEHIEDRLEELEDKIDTLK